MTALCCERAVHGRDAGQAMREIGPDMLTVVRDQVPKAPEGELHPGHGRVGTSPRDLGDGVLEGQEPIQAALYVRPEPERAVVVAGARDRHPFPAVINGVHFQPGCR